MTQDSCPHCGATPTEKCACALPSAQRFSFVMMGAQVSAYPLLNGKGYVDAGFGRHSPGNVQPQPGAVELQITIETRALLVQFMRSLSFMSEQAAEVLAQHDAQLAAASAPVPVDPFELPGEPP